ncbi:MAG: phosphatase PAP2 family protein [Arsenophonus sp.]
MLTHINLSLFSFIDANNIASVNNTIILTNFLAKRLILIFPLIIIIYCLLESSRNSLLKKVFICKTIFALIIGLIISSFIRVIFPQERPFILSGIGQHFFDHAPTPSFPSNHATIAFIFSFSFLFWLRAWIGFLLFIPALIIAWARVFVGVHWTFDMVGAFFVAIISCGISQLILEIFFHKLLSSLMKKYQILFAFLIKKGWIRN